MNEKQALVLLALGGTCATESAQTAITPGLDEKSYQEGKIALAKLDYDTALVKFKTAAFAGNVEAILQVAHMYRNGQGGGVYEEEAVRWYRLAAEKGNAEAMYNLGDMYNSGFYGTRGPMTSKEEALRWFILAAEKGNAKASASLAMDYLGKTKYANYEKRILKLLKNPLRSDQIIGNPIVGDRIMTFYVDRGAFVQAYKWARIMELTEFNSPIYKLEMAKYHMRSIESLLQDAERQCTSSTDVIRRRSIGNPILDSYQCTGLGRIDFDANDLERAKKLAIRCIESRFDDCE
jgi:TPR repeat protein